GVGRRLHRGFSAFAFPVRRPGNSRFARRHSYHYDADLGVLPIPAPLGFGGGLFGSPTGRHCPADRAAEKDLGPAGIQYGGGQGRAKTVDRAWLEPYSAVSPGDGNSIAL